MVSSRTSFTAWGTEPPWMQCSRSRARLCESESELQRVESSLRSSASFGSASSSSALKRLRSERATSPQEKRKQGERARKRSKKE